MFRPASQCLLRQPVRLIRPTTSARFLSTTPSHLRARSWKSSAARWGLAIGGVYFYNTSTLFAEEPAFQTQEHVANPDDHNLPSLESLSPSARAQSSNAPAPTSSSPPLIDPKAPSPPEEDAVDGSAQDLEDNAASQGAFNEETGEINWDCPCLGGMAHGPCGEQFRAAFSCFVYSKEEPKGMDCIDKFKGMQDCFREHPEIYAAELDDDDDELDPVEVDDEGSKIAASEPQDTPGVAASISASQSRDSAQEAQASTSTASTQQARRSIYDDTEEEQTPKSTQRAARKGSRDLPNQAHTGSAATAEKPLEDIVPRGAIDATNESATKKQEE